MNILPPYPPPLEYQSFSLMDNEAIKSRPSTEFVLINKLGENLLTVPTSCIFYLNREIGYTIDAGSSWGIYSNGVLLSSLILMDTALDGSLPSPVIGIFQFPSVDVGADTFVPALANAPKLDFQNINQDIVILDTWSGVSDYTGGSDDNYCRITTTYRILDVSTGLYI